MTGAEKLVAVAVVSASVTIIDQITFNPIVTALLGVVAGVVIGWIIKK